jgi:hypothetical protein
MFPSEIVPLMQIKKRSMTNILLLTNIVYKLQLIWGTIYNIGLEVNLWKKRAWLFMKPWKRTKL